MDEDEENQDLINQNSTRGKSHRQRTIVSSDEENVGESDESQDEEGFYDEEDNEEEEEDESDSEEDEEEEEEDQPQGNPGPLADFNGGLSSDEEKENCPICLNVFRDQVVGTPEHCNHYFCLDCIVEWSKNANSCPVDRITYSCINIRAHYGGAILKRVPVENKSGDTKDDDVTNCEVCGRSDREDRLLLCDYCDSGYHMECLTPALDVIPVNEWFCPECTATYHLVAAPDDAVIEDELGGQVENIFPTSRQLRTNLLRHRAIARTRQSERVRSNVNRIRTRARHVQSVPSNLLSSLLDETIEAVVAGLNTAVYQRNLTPRAPTRKRKRKSGKRYRRRTKRRKGRKRQIIRKTSTSHRRIARSLGLCNPTQGSSIPRVQRAPEQTISSLRNDIGAATLSVFGTPYDLNPIDSDEDNSHTSPLAAKRRVLSRSALRSHQPVARPISVSLSRGGVAPLPLGSVAAAEPVPDLLGSILTGQSMLMMKSSDIVISRDGSLTAKRSGECSSLRSSSGDELTPTNVLVPSTSHSGSSAATSSVNTWKPVEQLPQPSFASSLYSLSPLPSPPPVSSSSRLSMPNSSVSGMSTFRLKNAFTPRAVQVQSSAGRLNSKFAEPLPFNGTFHKQDILGSSDNSPPKKREIKHPCIYPAKRLDISEFPRIPKIKKERDNTNNESSKREESLTSCSPSKPSVNQLTGRGESKPLGRFAASEKNTRQEPQGHSRHFGGASSSHSASSSSKAPIHSNSSRNVGSSDSGGGGLRITISGSSSNSCRQFSPSTKDPFRTSDDKAQQKITSVYSTTIKKEKSVKNEIYDPFEPTGSDSGSHSSSPERPVTPPAPPPAPPPVPSSSTEIASTAPSTGVKIGAFRSFKFTTHSSKVGLCKLGPDFSGQSPSNKEADDTKTPVNVSPVLSSFIEFENDIKKEVIKEEKDDHADFRSACPFSGLKITSDLKSGGTRGFHFDVEDQPKISVKSEPESPPRIFHQGSTSNRLVWDTENPSKTISVSTSLSTEPQKKKTTVETELIMCSRSRSRTHSRDRESRSPSWSMEDRERGRKCKSKSHKGKRAHNDRSSSGSCERSKKKRNKEKKRERKNKHSDSRERKRSRSSSHSSSSHRTYNSKKKKKKKRDSKVESRGRSSSPEKEKKRKHKVDKSSTSREGNCRTKEKKKPKDDRGKQRPKSPQMTKDYKAHKSNEKNPHFRDQEITRHIVLSPNNNDTTITCTVSFKTECPPVTQEVKPTLILPLDEVNKKEPFIYMEREVVIKKEKDVELSDHDEGIKLEVKSPPWSPSLLDSLLPEHNSDHIQEFPSTADSSPLKDMPATSLFSPQASPLSISTEPPSPKAHSPQSIKEEPQPVSPMPVKKESDDLQWSPSHLEDFLLNELSDDVCSLEAASPDDVDLEEALLMKREDDDYKEPTVINFSKKSTIPFLQDDDNSGTEEAGNRIDEKTTKNNSLIGEGDKAAVQNENEVSSMSKLKPQIKRVTWNLHHKDSEDTPESSMSSPFQNAQQDISWPASAKLAANQGSPHEPNTSSEASGPLSWNPPNTDLQLVRQSSWNAGDPLGAPALERSLNEGSQIPWNAAETPHKVFPQTLPPLPLPPIFPPYAPLSEPLVPCVIQSSRTMIGQTPKPGALATTNEPKIQAANTGEGKHTKGKSKAKKGEKVKNEEYMKKLHMQERAVEEVKLAIKPFYQKREITKDEYKEILRKAVQKICHSKSGEINPVKVVNLVKGYVDKYKHIRNKQKKSGGLEDHDLGQGSPIC